MGRMGRGPWFGPKRFGWGWRPVSRAGWVVSLGYLALLLGVLLLSARVFPDRPGLTAALVAGLSVALVVVAALTGAPPGPRRRR